jgi:hypothetical protein
MHVENGVPADQIEGARWRKSRVSNPNGSCVEVTGLTDGSIAIRNSRHPSGPALVYTQAEMAAFLQGAKDGEFDNLIIGLPNRMLRRRARPATDGFARLGLGQHELPGDIVLCASTAGRGLFALPVSLALRGVAVTVRYWLGVGTVC